MKAALLLSLALLAGASGAVAHLREPQGYWTGPMRGDVPDRLSGATVVDDAGLDRLLATGRPVLIDVSPQEQRPQGTRLWLPTHRSIPGSRWLPGAGEGLLHPERAALLTAVAGRRTAIVVFCHPRCWASWNAGKRLVQAGHRRIFWYKTGIEGWQERHATAVIAPDPEWIATGASSS